MLVKDALEKLSHEIEFAKSSEYCPFRNKQIQAQFHGEIETLESLLSAVLNDDIHVKKHKTVSREDCINS